MSLVSFQPESPPDCRHKTYLTSLGLIPANANTDSTLNCSVSKLGTAAALRIMVIMEGEVRPDRKG
jgi:hypothetical protein